MFVHASGLPDFSWRNIPKRGKIYPMSTKYTKWSQNRQNGHKIYQHRPLQDPPKFTRIGIFGLKIYHLATLTCILTLFSAIEEKYAKFAF
jgi:hypothetical protein